LELVDISLDAMKIRRNMLRLFWDFPKVEGFISSSWLIILLLDYLFHLSAGLAELIKGAKPYLYLALAWSML